MGDGAREALPQRIQAGGITALIAVGGVTAYGGEDFASASPSLDLAKIASAQAPTEYARVPDAEHKTAMAQIAAQPVSPGYDVHPSSCAPQPAAVPQSTMSNMKVVAFRSRTAIMSLVGYDAGAGETFDVGRCADTTIIGPDGFEVMTVPTDKLDIPGADRTRGSQSVVREKVDSQAFSQYTYVAQVAERYRVVVFLTPLLNERSERVLPVAPAHARDLLRSAVAQLVPPTTTTPAPCQRSGSDVVGAQR